MSATLSDYDYKIEAEEQIRLLADLACPPDIEDQLIWILARCQLASTWAASTVYRYGQIVRPTVDNGRWLKCVQGGTSAATEPVWVSWSDHCWYAYDGTVAWHHIPAQPNIYDIRAGVHEALMQKAAKCTHLVNVNVGGGVSISAGDMQKQFVQRAMEYLPVQIAI